MDRQHRAPRVCPHPLSSRRWATRPPCHRCPAAADGRPRRSPSRRHGPGAPDAGRSAAHPAGQRAPWLAHASTADPRSLGHCLDRQRRHPSPRLHLSLSTPGTQRGGGRRSPPLRHLGRAAVARRRSVLRRGRDTLPRHLRRRLRDLRHHLPRRVLRVPRALHHARVSLRLCHPMREVSPDLHRRPGLLPHRGLRRPTPGVPPAVDPSLPRGRLCGRVPAMLPIVRQHRPWPRVLRSVPQPLDPLRRRRAIALSGGRTRLRRRGAGAGRRDALTDGRCPPCARGVLSSLP